MKDDLYVQKGITEKQIDELIRRSRADEKIKRYTSDSKRFKNKKVFNAWKTNKKIFILMNKKQALLGLIWFEHKQIPVSELRKQFARYKITFAIRLYKEARGRGLAKPFMTKAFAKTADKYIWLSTLYNNKTAINLYTKFGFKSIGEYDKRQYMIYEKTK